MLQFLPMLMKGAQSVAGKGGEEGGGLANQFMQALGASGQPGRADSNVGMQFANAGMQPPAVPNAQSLVAGMQQPQQQPRNLPTFNPLLQMLFGGK